MMGMVAQYLCARHGSRLKSAVGVTPVPATGAPMEGDALALFSNAWRVPAGSGLTLNLGAAPEGAICRVGLLDGGEGSPVQTVVFVDDEAVTSFATSGGHTWHDERVALPHAGSSCRLELSATAEFWISHAEVFVPDAASPAVLIFLIDALRQDHLGCYGYPLDTSPNIDAFAKDAVRLRGVTPSTSWTRASVATLFTSTYPSVHGAEDRPDMLRENLPSLAVQLGLGGLETHCFMTNRNCIPVWGFGNDFHRFRDADTEHWVSSDDAAVVDLTIDTVQDVAGRPWYAYVHTMGPHEPYTPPEPFKERFNRALYAERDEDPAHREALALYDGEIAYTDSQFGRLIAVIKEQGLYDNALIIVMADHGEEFWDHGGTGHGKTLYEEQLRIPFLVKLPGNACAGEVRDGLAEMVDRPPPPTQVSSAPPPPWPTPPPPQPPPSSPRPDITALPYFLIDATTDLTVDDLNDDLRALIGHHVDPDRLVDPDVPLAEVSDGTQD